MGDGRTRHPPATGPHGPDRVTAVAVGRTAEAVVLDWTSVLGHASAGEQLAVLGQLRALLGLGTNVVLIADGSVSRVRKALPAKTTRGRLWVSTPGAALVEITTSGVQEATGVRDVPVERGEHAGNFDELSVALSVLGGIGIGAGLVLLVSTSSSHLQTVVRLMIRVVPAVLAGGSDDGVPLADVLDEQIRRRRARRVPSVDEDPDWIVREDSGDPLRQRIAETVCTIGAGGIATRGAAEEPAEGTVPLLLADGVYGGSNGDELLPGPEWTKLEIEPRPTADERLLDLRSGVLLRVASGPASSSLRTLRLASVVRPGVMAMRAEVTGGRLRPGAPLHSPRSVVAVEGAVGGRHWARTGLPEGPGIAAVATQRTARAGGARTTPRIDGVERLAAFISGRRRQPRLSDAAALLAAAAGVGFDAILAEHRAAWTRRWETVGIRVPDDPATQLAVRFALFQLWCNVSRHDEAAVGARGLSGIGYAGHVFWDADAFILPAMVSIDPEAALAMLRYRKARLPVARSRAAALGYAGARFPWESAASGEDVTPRSGMLGGVRVPIRTGQLEEHITADVAWAAAHYARWHGTGSAEHRANRALLIDTARYWMSRCRLDAAGRAHIDAVIGPDEYHEGVDDNAFTNVMARWNLRAGAAALDDAALDKPAGSKEREESGRLRDLAERLVDGYDPATGRYEQFAGYYALEPLLVAQVASPPVAADLLLGRDRVRGSQLIKQPDVLMLHHLVPDEVAPGSLAANLDFYGPRTAHGSSLSPAVTAALLARAGRADEALEVLQFALDLDLGDTTGMTAAGLHLANLASVWQAVLSGFAGVRVESDTMVIDPQLPRRWHSLELRFHCLARRVRLEIKTDEVIVHADGPLRARLAGGPVLTCARAAAIRFARPPACVPTQGPTLSTQTGRRL